jgi:hypothetical protein
MSGRPEKGPYGVGELFGRAAGHGRAKAYALGAGTRRALFVLAGQRNTERTLVVT